MKHKSRIFLLIVLAAIGFPSRAIAHGASIDYQRISGIKINSTYDSGEPMSNAQVSIYSPDNPATPWLTGNTDENGGFIFVPDPNQVGNWEVKVRQAGHGDLITIALGETEVNSKQIQPVFRPNYTTMQKALMMVCVGWGFVGTALFFSKQPFKHQQ